MQSFQGVPRHALYTSNKPLRYTRPAPHIHVTTPRWRCTVRESIIIGTLAAIASSIVTTAVIVGQSIVR